MNKVIESDMDFTPLFDSHQFDSFYIEESDLYKALKGKGVKTVEFVALKQRERKENQLYFIEAKKISLDPLGNEIPEKKSEAEQEYQAWCNKFTHSLNLIVARKLELRKHMKHEFPEKLAGNIDNCRIIFVLIFNGRSKEWCDGIKSKLEEDFKIMMRLWDLDILVIPKELAQKKGFIN